MNKKIYCLAATGLVFLYGCSDKKENSRIEESIKQEAPVIETATPADLNKETVSIELVAPQEASVPDVSNVSSGTLLQEVPEKTNENIQTALKNAGLYEGQIDGNIGPKTKKAIEDFQAQNGLKVDGVVGPMTWQKLSVYFNAAPAGVVTSPVVTTSAEKKN